MFGAANSSSDGRDVPAQQSQKGCLSTTVRPDESHSQSSRDDEVQFPKKLTPTNFVAYVLQFDQALGLALGRGEIDLCGRTPGSLVEVCEFLDQLPGLVNSSFRLAGPRLRATPQPLDF